MENSKKRPSPTKDPKSKKKVKIETGEDAVKALDDIVLLLHPDTVEMEISDLDVTSKIPEPFFKNHTRMFFATTGYDVYMNSSTNSDLKTPLKNDIKALMDSHDRWEMIARQLSGRCVDLKSEIALLLKTSSPVPLNPSTLSISPTP